MKLLRALKYRDDNRVLSYPIKKYPEIYNQFGEKWKCSILKIRLWLRTVEAVILYGTDAIMD